MINLTVQQVLRVIELAERTLEGPSFPLGISYRDAAGRWDAYHDPAVRALESEIASIEREARNELFALMYLGRGDDNFSFSELVQKAEKLKDGVLTSVIAAKSPRLPDYLRRGLSLAMSESLSAR